MFSGSDSVFLIFYTLGIEWANIFKGHLGRLRQLGCPIPQGNHFLVRTTKIYFKLDWPGKYKSEVSFSNLITHVINIKNHILISYKPLRCSDYITLHMLFCYSGMFGQAVLWPSLPDRVIKKRENCHSLHLGPWF